VPWAVITGLAASMLPYLALQLVFGSPADTAL